MSLDFAILGFLKKSPATGYELQKKIEKSINHFWTSTQSQIYRTLNRMEEEALIISEIHYQDEKPNKKVYSITKEGNDELIKWLSTPITIPSHRNPFLVQLFFSGNINKKTIKSNLLHYKKEMEQRLHFLNSDEAKQMVESAGKKIDHFIYQSLVDNGISVLQSEIDWADKLLNKIETL
jgi:PadR family transcriptional regulator, regulatory protein AphA